MKKNIGKYDKNSFIDKKGVEFLSLQLMKNERIATHIKSEDKTPNIDGYIEYLEEGIPIKSFEVQVKTSEKFIYKNDKIKVNSIDTKFLNYIKSRITENTGFLFLVDIKNKRIFFKKIDDDSLRLIDFEGKNTIGITCSEKDEIKEVESFEKILKGISNENEKIEKFIDKERINELQEAIDEINIKLNTTYKVIKNIFFSDVWRLGIKFNDENIKNHYNCALYKIVKKQKVQEIKIYTNEDFYKPYIYNHSVFGKSFNKEEFCRGFYKEIIDKFFDNDLQVLVLSNEANIEKLNEILNSYNKKFRIKKDSKLEIERLIKKFKEELKNDPFSQKRIVLALNILTVLKQRGIKEFLYSHTEYKEKVNKEIIKKLKIISKQYKEICKKLNLNIERILAKKYSIYIKYNDVNNAVINYSSYITEEKEDVQFEIKFSKKNDKKSFEEIIKKRKKRYCYGYMLSLSCSYDTVVYDMLKSLLQYSYYYGIEKEKDFFSYLE